MVPKRGRSRQAKRGPPRETKAAEPLEEELVELDEAMRLLKTSRSTLYRWIRQGRVRAMKAGRQYRFRREDLRRFLEGEAPDMDLPLSPAPFLKSLRAELRKAGWSGAKGDKGPGGLDEALDMLLELGARLGASDIHAAPHAEFDGSVRVPVRLRLTGVLETVAELDARLLPHFIAAAKRAARCDVLDTTSVQEGSATRDMEGKRRTMRFCFLPSSLGESMAVRLFLPAESNTLTLEDCEYTPDNRARIEEAVAAPWGIVLFCGPTGCGKMTTMLAALREIDGQTHKVVCLEEAPFTHLPWVNQVAVDEEAGQTRIAALKGAMSSDPDVVVVGEVDDPGVFDASVRMALTGRLVLGYLHANGAEDALARLIDRGADPHEAADAVRLVVSQRLVRRACPKCSKPARLGKALRARMDKLLTEGGVDPSKLTPKFRDAPGCPHCRGTGHAGRFPMAETLRVTPAVAEAIRARKPDDALRRVAVGEGMVTLHADLLRKAYEGQTTVREAVRMAGLDEGL